jgi:hypothetical protein
MRSPPTVIAWILIWITLATSATARAFLPYEAIAYLRPDSPTGEDLTRAVAEAAKKRGYARVDEAGRGVALQPGFERLMTFKAVECREYAGTKCPLGASVVMQGLIFVDREIKSNSIVIRFMQWCASSCEGNVKATVDRLAEEIETTTP